MPELPAHHPIVRQIDASLRTEQTIDAFLDTVYAREPEGRRYLLRALNRKAAVPIFTDAEIEEIARDGFPAPGESW